MPFPTSQHILSKPFLNTPSNPAMDLFSLRINPKIHSPQQNSAGRRLFNRHTRSIFLSTYNNYKVTSQRHVSAQNAYALLTIKYQQGPQGYQLSTCKQPSDTMPVVPKGPNRQLSNVNGGVKSQQGLKDKSCPPLVRLEPLNGAHGQNPTKSRANQHRKDNLSTRSSSP